MIKNWTHLYLREQEIAGLDICTDGDCRFDQDIGGQSWTSYPPHHMSGFDTAHPKLARAGAGGIGFPRGHILHDYQEARVMPRIIGPVGRGEMQITQKKVGIGVIDHHTLQVESPDEVADLVRLALTHIPAERLVLSSDCGMDI